ncbi:hypothetical protein H632_c1113p0, partial [Helicosporidium sp. ATCC 50920]
MVGPGALETLRLSRGISVERHATMEDATELELIPATPLAAVAQRKSGSELRAKAVFKAMEKILEGPVTDSAHLWVLARVMSRDEFEEALEERALADLPRNPLPDQDDDELTALARKLGNAAAAQERFDKLLHQMRAQRRGAGERAVLREPGPPPAADGATKVAGEARPDARIVELEAPLAPLDATLDAARPGPVFDPSRVSPEASAPPPDR